MCGHDTFSYVFTFVQLTKEANDSFAELIKALISMLFAAPTNNLL